MEIWKDIEGYEGEYQVSNLGNVRSLPHYYNWRGVKKFNSGKTLRPYKTGKYPYLTVQIRGKGYLVHRLVAEAFIKNPYDYKEINHKDENRLNNVVENLEWCTRKYNIEYSVKKVKAGVRKVHGTPIYRADIETGEIIKKYDFIVDVTEDGFDPKQISAVCSGSYKGKQKGRYKGYMWGYMKGGGNNYEA